jgi:hypothetical protein
MNNIQLWDDLDYMIDEMRIKPYDWDILGDFPAGISGSQLAEEWIDKPLESLKYLCPNKHECLEANKEEMKGYIYCNNCYSENPIIRGVKGMYYPINSDKVTKL